MSKPGKDMNRRSALKEAEEWLKARNAAARRTMGQRWGGPCKPTTVFGTTFSSRKSAAAALGVNHSKLLTILRAEQRVAKTRTHERRV